MKHICIFFGFFTILWISANTFALTATPVPPTKHIILTGCQFRLQEPLWYDVCLTPAIGYNAYYNISNTTLVDGWEKDDERVIYPPEQMLGDEDNNGVYERIVWVEYPYEWLSDNPPLAYPLHAFWKHGSYTAFIKANDTEYLAYDKNTFYIHPDFPFFYSFLPGGSPTYLNIKWNGRYNITPGSCIPDRDLNIRCYLNGVLISEIDPSIRYRPAREYISTAFTSPQQYQYYNDFGHTIHASSYAPTSDNFACNSFDPEHPWLNYWNTIRFKPIHFSASYRAPPTVTLGEEFIVKVDVSNHGLFSDSYTINVSSTDPSYISVIHGYEKIENLIADCRKKTFEEDYTSFPVEYTCTPTSASFEAKLIPIITPPPGKDVKIIVTVKSETSQITLSLAPLEVKAGVKSLSEFDFFGILQIMVLATVILMFLKKIL